MTISRRGRGAICCVGTVAAGLAVLSGCAYSLHSSQTIAQLLSRQQVAIKDEWRRYVLNVDGDVVGPRAVTIEGDTKAVVNPDGLLGSGGTTLTTSAAHSARIIVDLGVLASGYVELGVRRAERAPIRLSYAEERDHLGMEGDASDDPADFFYQGRTLATEDDPDGRFDVFASPVSETVLVSHGLRGSQRFIAITLDGAGSVTLDFIRVRQTNYRGEYDGYFLSSDDMLNRAWYASAYQLNLSTVRDLRKIPPGPWVIVDGPKRDRVAYAGDLEFVALGAYLQGEAYSTIVRDTLNLFVCRQNEDGTLPVVGMPGEPCPIDKPGTPGGTARGYLPPEAVPVRLDTFTALWVIALADYVRFTGDADYALNVMPVARRAMKFFMDRAGEDGLWKSEDYDGKLAMNWHTPDKASGVGGYDNVIYCRALMSLASLERSVARDATAAQTLENRAARVRNALLAKLWDPQAGAMLLNLDDPMRNHAADANAAALRWGLLDPARARQAMAFMRDRLKTPYGIANSEFKDNPYMTRYISPYINGQAALGMFRYGGGQDALDLIRASWGHMIERGSGLPWEEMSVTGTPVVPRPGTPLNAGSDAGLAHAWSTVVPALTMRVIGVEPLSNGYSTWSISPQPVDLAWAQGCVPTPRGAISVRWKRDRDSDSFVLSVATPVDTQGSIAVPLLGKPRTIAMDGKIVWQNGRPLQGVQATDADDSVTFEAMTGSHTFAWAR